MVVKGAHNGASRHRSGFAPEVVNSLSLIRPIILRSSTVRDRERYHDKTAPVQNLCDRTRPNGVIPA